MEELLNKIICWLENIFNIGYGDPDPTKSKAGVYTIAGPTTDWLPAATVSRSSIVTVRNVGATEVEYHYHDKGTQGQTLPVGEVFVYDQFKGTIWIRNAAGAGGSIRWLIGARH
jgi:hypothetical protein